MEPSKRRPDFYGLVTLTHGDGQHFIKVGKLAAWRQEVPPATKRPPFTGNLELDGKKYRIALWEKVELSTRQQESKTDE